MSDSWFADLLAASGFLRRYPQFAGVVAQMEPMATTAVPMMAIARHWRGDGQIVLRLYVNRDWLLGNPQHFAGVLQHEIHHALCGHLDDPSFHRVAEPRWMELAMELAANENIVEPMPAGFCWQAFTAFGIGPGQSTHERYRLLLAAAASGRLQIFDEDELDRQMPGWRRQAGSGGRGPRVVVMPKRSRLLPWNNRPEVMDGTMTDEHRPGRTTGDGGRGLGDALDRAQDGARAETWGRGGWLGGPTQERQLAAWRMRILAHLRGEAGGAGDVAGRGQATKELPRHVAQAAGGHLAWPGILRSVLRSPRVVQSTWLRPNRRFPDRLGEVPGRLRRPPRPRLLVGLDTSASMNAAAMSTALAEIRRLARFAEVTIVEVDSAVHRVHRDLHVEMVTGGGDTDFHPLFSLRDGARCDGIVYFTDGIGAWPVLAPPVPVLWVLLGEQGFDCPWGTVVRLRPGK